MTATVPQQGPPGMGGPTLVRLDARPGFVYAYDVRIGSVVVEFAYIGQTRNVARRDLQHRGLAPQRDGVVKEQPWADQIVRLRVVRSGVWTNGKLDDEERDEIRTRLPLLNCRDNPNPNRIPIFTQHEQRKQRDPNWVTPDWTRRPAPVLPCPETSRPVPRRSVWSWLAATPAARSAKRRLRRVAPWLVVAVAVWVTLLFQHIPPDDAAPFAGIAAFGLWAGLRWLRNGWRDLTKPKPRRRQSRRTNRRSSR